MSEPNDPRLSLMRRTALELAKAHGREVSEFTCDGCPKALECDVAYDLYNTHGDCLADK